LAVDGAVGSGVVVYDSRDVISVVDVGVVDDAIVDVIIVIVVVVVSFKHYYLILIV